MRWFRANRKFGGRLALVALAVQFVLSFGHIHTEDIYGSGSGAASRAAKIALPVADHSRPLPAKRPANHTDDYCAICASLYLLGSSFVAEAPQLPLPAASYAVEHVNIVAAVFITPRRAPFQSRAPPLA